MTISLDPGETKIWRIVQAIKSLIDGGSNVVGQVTLRANQTTTVVTKAVDPAAVNVSVGKEVFLTPRTANAAGALATTYITAVGQGTFTITHANTAAVDKTFGWEARG